jgi:hypothetical protein
MLLIMKELQRRFDIGVLRPCGATTWVIPTFIIPKEDGKNDASLFASFCGSTPFT